ncbi:class I SAM-dependent methyltransferase [Methylomonas fluvii]|uniref:Class I SAM-dependent methyltransferase n=1 Tax=Methylomonas fluvii TaxID=1854564 RepID=A0ABR9DJZ7_9GAMM|nr:class I SAM-dependent methyltransferase [Methylomonas fluvii]MBD9363350.1 class I SAM-dependent methyltransferase [Methylomonas fluvii]
MNDAEKRRKFFYAMKEANMYDETIEWVAPHYCLMHEMMFQLVEESLGDELVSNDQNIIALDIGSGTGEEAIKLLEKIPTLKLIGIDLCQPMLDIFQERADELRIDRNRYRLIEADILEEEILNKIQCQAKDSFNVTKFNLVISAFTIHHFSSDEDKNECEKEKVFGLIHSLLKDGGVFILGDLFNYKKESAILTDTIAKWETNWISDNFEREAKSADDIDSERAMKLRELKNAWVWHYRWENKLDSMTRQMEVLKRSGFTEVGNPFRYWQVGLLWAKK